MTLGAQVGAGLGMLGPIRSVAEEIYVTFDNVAQATTPPNGSRGAKPVQWDHWRAIDAHEKARGRATQRPRLKVASRDDLLELAHR